MDSFRLHFSDRAFVPFSVVTQIDLDGTNAVARTALLSIAVQTIEQMRLCFVIATSGSGQLKYHRVRTVKFTLPIAYRSWISTTRDFIQFRTHGLLKNNCV